MKLDIQPKYEPIKITCSCGNSFETRSTLCKDLHVDVCDQCHSFYTGKQRVVSAGRVDTFKKRFGSFTGKVKKETEEAKNNNEKQDTEEK